LSFSARKGRLCTPVGLGQQANARKMVRFANDLLGSASSHFAVKIQLNQLDFHFATFNWQVIIGTLLGSLAGNDLQWPEANFQVMEI
jgi:hypothetical protein